MIRMLDIHHQKKVRAIGLVTAVILCFITSGVTLGFVRFMIGMNDSTRSNLERLVAQTAVSNAVNELEIIEYDKLESEPRKNVSGMGNVNIDREIIVTGETVNETDGKKKDAIINIYRNGETEPVLTVTRTLSSQGSSTNVPIGTVITWASWTNPDNKSGKWLECNGQSVNPNLYPKLAAIMRNTPDYQGVFLRGYGRIISNHYSVIEHSSADLGQLQGDSIRNITGSFTEVNAEGYANGVFTYKRNNGGRGYWDAWDGSHTISFNSSLVTPSSNEIRPINKSVRYFIKAS